MRFKEHVLKIRLYWLEKKHETSLTYLFIFYVYIVNVTDRPTDKVNKDRMLIDMGNLQKIIKASILIAAEKITFPP